MSGGGEGGRGGELQKGQRSKQYERIMKRGEVSGGEVKYEERTHPIKYKCPKKALSVKTEGIGCSSSTRVQREMLLAAPVKIEGKERKPLTLLAASVKTEGKERKPLLGTSVKKEVKQNADSVNFILKGAFQSRHENKDVKSETIVSQKSCESWQVAENSHGQLKICKENNATVDRRKNIAPSKLVGTLGSSVKEKNDFKWDNPVIGCNHNAGIPTLTSTTTRKRGASAVERVFRWVLQSSLVVFSGLS